MSSKSLKKGLPILVLVAMAPSVLKQFNSIRYEYRKANMLSKEDQLKVEETAEARKAGVAVDEKTEAMLQKAREESGREWKNIRGPRPWEDSRQIQNEQR